MGSHNIFYSISARSGSFRWLTVSPPSLKEEQAEATRGSFVEGRNSTKPIMLYLVTVVLTCSPPGLADPPYISTMEIPPMRMTVSVS